MLCVLKVLTIIIIFSLFIFLFIWKLAFNYQGEIKLNLKLFRQIYYINPEKWRYIEYWCDSIRHLKYRGYRVKLTFFAFCWFISDRLFYKYRKNKKRKRNNLIWVLQDCQKDIEYLKEQANRDIERALQTQKRILDNWR